MEPIHRKKRIADSFLSAVAVLLLWQILVSLWGIPRFILPGPIDVFRALYANSGLIAENAAVTFGEVLGGFFSAALLASSRQSCS